MKLNVKMMLLFSAMMLAAVTVLSSYSTQLNIDSFTDLSNQQFHNISHTVSEALDQQISKGYRWHLEYILHEYNRVTRKLLPVYR